ncbi:S-adenosylmethionine:tRNA ribosyltransferase-isomerase [Cesiribacter sp. SM1]|uniref:S-adenosylmethionine:tRNA ribosyltransferase-isomerase n=1 Tax=Cesiribacter sp. SM1 TaxID=2861196 RepID=UPI001CD56ACE|nr:S-adenosylmethionine:tRNA ribosyltransferase-isomerase [Cesiribacter sp. SM1]
MLNKEQNIFDLVQLDDYRYELPDERIARHPLPERDKSKLLFYSAGDIEHRRFFELPRLLPANSLLVFNNTKVIPARLGFKKETGAQIEIFLLQPLAPTTDIQLAMGASGFSSWQCIIGNRKRWRDGKPLQLTLTIADQEVVLEASHKSAEDTIVDFSWWPATYSFAEIVEAAGEIPLPPYLKRKAENEDRERYQTVYSKARGAVAAPTAGLHFTAGVLEQIEAAGHQTEQLTLHVGAGTFQPIKEKKLSLHPMHREQVVVSEANVQHLISHEGPVIAVGTTSMRTLESLYWFGVKLMQNPEEAFFISKNESYRYSEEELPSYKEALAAVLNRIQASPEKQITGETEIFIIPGYIFRICKGLITNFHQPESTLMLLVAAFVGPDWKQIYQQALSENYRFLSYGDSSLLLPAPRK